jgi:hypothetical protein
LFSSPLFTSATPPLPAPISGTAFFLRFELYWELLKGSAAAIATGEFFLCLLFCFLLISILLILNLVSLDCLGSVD